MTAEKKRITDKPIRNHSVMKNDATKAWYETQSKISLTEERFKRNVQNVSVVDICWKQEK